MKLGNQVVLIAILAIGVSVSGALLVQDRVLHRQGTELTRAQMREAVLEAENVRETMSSLNADGAFDREKLLAEYHASGDLRGSTIYRTIPVVAAWRAIEKVAASEGWSFRVPKHQARNRDNLPTPEEEPVLERLESGQVEEYFEVSRERNEIVFARPIRLSADCLVCHGDPATSASGDGKDPLGFPMEGWKEGEVHGAFLLRASLAPVDEFTRASLLLSLEWVAPLTVLVALGAAFYTRRRIIRPLEASIEVVGAASHQTAAAAREISSASQQLAAGASQQAASLEETHSAVEEISATARQNVGHAGDAREIAVATRGAADSGTAEMAAMNRAMDEIKNSSLGVQKIIKAIDEIAFQTNILALNAAVEAARAGEAGAGFSVVADEVRALAQRSAVAARETAENISASIRKSEHGVVMSSRVSSALAEISAKARRMEEVIAAIAESSSEQSASISQVGSAVGDIDKVTQVNAAAAEESSAAAEQLNAQSMELDSAVRALARVVSGVRGAEDSSPAR